MGWKCAKAAKSVTFGTKKTVKQKDSEYKTSSLWVKITAKTRRKRVNYSKNALSTHSEKVLHYLLEMVQNCLKCHFLNQKKVKEKDTNLKNSSPVGRIDRKKSKKKMKLLLKWFSASFKKNPPICAENVPKVPKMSLIEPREKSQNRMATSKFALQ